MDNPAMAQATEPFWVKRLCGLIAARVELFEEAARALEAAFGAVESASDVMPFDFTHYYDAQMGSPLYRRFLAFGPLMSPDTLADAKLATNALEADFAHRVAPGAPPRPINLDVGYVDSAKLVLASMKDFSHRIYLGRGVFAEVTLMFRKGSWEKLPWTFPDYASGRYDAFLTAARRRLREQLAGESAP
jgi:hypothetical protein